MANNNEFYPMNSGICVIIYDNEREQEFEKVNNFFSNTGFTVLPQIALLTGNDHNSEFLATKEIKSIVHLYASGYDHSEYDAFAFILISNKRVFENISIGSEIIFPFTRTDKLKNKPKLFFFDFNNKPIVSDVKENEENYYNEDVDLDGHPFSKSDESIAASSSEAKQLDRIDFLNKLPMHKDILVAYFIFNNNSNATKQTESTFLNELNYSLEILENNTNIEICQLLTWLNSKVEELDEVPNDINKKSNQIMGFLSFLRKSFHFKKFQNHSILDNFV